MDCQHFNNQIHDWLDGALEPVAAARLATHAGICRACAAGLAEERRLRLALRDLPTPAPRRGFAAEALRVAVLAERASRHNNHRHDWTLAFAGAMAASLCIALALGLRESSAPVVARSTQQPAVIAVGLQPSLQTVSLTVGQVESLRLRIEAPRDFADVRFSVDLPDHVSLAGQPGIRAMTWQGALRKGDNMLELPLVADVGAAGLMQARVSWGAFEQRIEASLVSAPAAPTAGQRSSDVNGI